MAGKKFDVEVVHGTPGAVRAKVKELVEEGYDFVMEYGGALFFRKPVGTR